MIADLFAGKYPSKGWLARVTAAVAVAVGVSVAIFILINGPKLRAAIENERAAAIEQEDRAFCAKFALTPGTNAFVTCANELSRIRWLHEQRLNSNNGIL